MKYIDSLRNSIDELIADRNAYVIGEDIMDPYGGAFKVTKGLSCKYPDNIIGVPMSEQGFTAMSVGMALMGEYVIEEIMFGDFITLTADQLINHAAKFYDLYGQKLHLVIRTPSGGYRGYGATHSQSLEKIFLGIPGLRVVAANIFYDVGKLLKEVIEEGKPTLFIENKLDYPKELCLSEFDFFERLEVNRKVRLSIKGEIPEYTIITYGGISDMAVDAAKQLMLNEEIAADVLIVSELSNVNSRKLIEMIRTDNIIVIEEGTGKFGFSAQISAELSCENKVVHTLTSYEGAIPCAELAEKEVLLQTQDIYNAILTFFK